MLTEAITVVAAAIKKGRKIYSIPKPARHSDVVHAMIRMGLGEPSKEEYGFKLSDGIFATRNIAKRFAYRAGQITRERFMSEKVFTTEDLW